MHYISEQGLFKLAELNRRIMQMISTKNRHKSLDMAQLDLLSPESKTGTLFFAFSPIIY